MRISVISKATRVHKAMTVANNTSLCSTILVVLLEFIPVDRAEISHAYEHTTEFVLATELARLPGSYEEALKNYFNYIKHKRISASFNPARNIRSLVIHLQIAFTKL